MCGIVACRAAESASGFLTQALQRLEYRGYDSAGLAVTGITRDRLLLTRTVGRVAALTDRIAQQRLSPDFGIGIGHSRWATHGGVSEANAHPHRDCHGGVAVVHNGIIDNADELRADLQAQGHTFASEVDTEVVAHLLEDACAVTGSLGQATVRVVRELRGTWALAVAAAASSEVVLASHRSPLVVGSADGEHFAASDVAALVGRVDTVSVLLDDDVVVLGDEVVWLDAAGHPTAPRPPVPVPWAAEDVDRGAYQDFMEKEIAEQSFVVGRLLERLLPGMADGWLWHELDLPPVSGVRFVACGSSLNAARTTVRAIQLLSGLPAEAVIASEYDSALVPRAEKGVLTVAVSQSGETTDLLHALGDVRGPVLAVTNRPHSSLARRADAVLECDAGPEIGVAATKTFTTQVVAGAALALAHAAATRSLPEQEIAAQCLWLAGLPGRLDLAHLTAFPVASALVEELADARQVFFVSRGAGLPYAAEGALKLKEITYLPAEATAAGEFKHGPIALIEDGTPVIVLESGDPSRLAGACAELASRGARIVRVGSAGPASFPVLPHRESPWGPVEGVLAFQHLARCLAVALGRDADKPRNLAKSVTVL